MIITFLLQRSYGRHGASLVTDFLVTAVFCYLPSVSVLSVKFKVSRRLDLCYVRVDGNATRQSSVKMRLAFAQSNVRQG